MKRIKTMFVPIEFKFKLKVLRYDSKSWNVASHLIETREYI